MLIFFKRHKFFSAFLTVIILILALLPLASIRPIYDQDELSYGVTFSPRLVRGMGLNWQTVFTAALDELNARKFRLMAYWDEIENKQGIFYFDDLDWQINEADKRGAQIILAVGGRLPRWPECHVPDWAKNLNVSERQENILNYLRQIIERYKGRNNITAWQIENEPFLPYFGDCQKLDQNFLDKEIKLVRSLDSRPIVITDSGELSIWIPAASRADIFGTSLYRNTYSQHLNRYISYPLQPWFFRLKANLTEFLSMPKPRDLIVIELQAEPWGPNAYYQLTKAERERTMNLDKFKDILEFARLSGFREFYLWGVEYWYWEREVNGDAGMWEEAKTLF
ncbi:MAG: endo-1,4-beta-xylanase [Patescibacteria group bacterium]